MAKEKAPVASAAPAEDRKRAIEAAMGQIEKMYGKGYTNQHLSCKSRIVDLHIEFKQLIVSFARNSLTYQIHTMSYIVQIVNAGNLNNMSFIVHKISIRLNSSLNSLEVCTLFQFYINHTAMNACTYRNSHGQSIFNTGNRADSYRVSHTATRTKVCISNTFRSNSLQ